MTVAGVAVSCAPRAAVEVHPASLARVAAAGSFFVDGASARAAGPGPTATQSDLSADLEARVDSQRLALAERREEAEILLYYEQADWLPCVRCRQGRERWYWWGFVFAPDGEEVAAFHGEVEKGRREPVALFAREVRRLLRRARRTVRAADRRPGGS